MLPCSLLRRCSEYNETVRSYARFLPPTLVTSVSLSVSRRNALASNFLRENSFIFLDSCLGGCFQARSLRDLALGAAIGVVLSRRSNLSRHDTCLRSTSLMLHEICDEEVEILGS